MVSDIHALIQQFLQPQTVTALVTAEQTASADRYLKAGVVPFVREDPYRFYLMKPHAKIAGLGEPAFQLCKGTRMHHVPNVGWRDIRESGSRMPQMETLIQTALREGMEELGLKPDNIARLFDVGPYGFSSATTGKSKEMWLFAAEINDPDDFLAEREVAGGTAARQWLSAGEFDVVGRQDHRYILEDIESRLAAFYKE